MYKLTLSLIIIFFCCLAVTSIQSRTTDLISNQNTNQNNTYKQWDFLSVTEVGALDFIKKYPNYDGRGVIIAVMDTGVDMGVPGLTKTSDGKTKVIDAQDFTGQGDIQLEKITPTSENNSTVFKHSSGKKFYWNNKKELPHPEKEKVKSKENNVEVEKEVENYYIGFLDETKFKNSNAGSDINDNGKTDDVFGILAFEIKKGNDKVTYAYIDTNLDRDLSDQEPLQDYKIKQDTFRLSDVAIEDAKYKLTFCLNIFLKDNKLTIHFDDGGHGSHVAGIASGFELNGQKSLNGIAPGAQVISLKIGNNTLSGGATVTESMKKALEYGVKYAKDNNVPLVFNISYGINSVIPGRSDIDLLMDKILDENENIIICTSAGNSGPGINTTGTPAASNRVISVGALLDKQYAKYRGGAQLNQNIITHFSSRGGPVAKPDIVCPGAASSTVPRWSERENMWGTSMASPQATGFVALLLSAVKQYNSKFIIKNAIVKRAIKHTATTLDNYLPIEQGSGLPNIEKAFEQLKAYSNRNEHNLLLNYSIETLSPMYKDDKGSTSYWRSNGYYPTIPNLQRFGIKPIFPKEILKSDKDNFYRAFDLKSDVDWIKVREDSTYIKGSGEAEVLVEYISDKLTKPGVYCGKVIGYLKSEDKQSYTKNNIEFELFNTIIIPNSFSINNQYTQFFENQSIPAGENLRYFISVPSGATSLECKFEVLKDKFADMSVYIFDTDGHEVDFARMDSEKEKSRIMNINGENLLPGIYEIVVNSKYSNSLNSEFNLTVSFQGLKVSTDKIKLGTFKIEEKPTFNYSVYNLFTEKFDGKAESSLDGYQKTSEKEIKGKDTFSYNFSLNNTYKGAEFKIVFPKEIYNQFTDIAINIYDSNNKSVLKSGMENETTSFIFDNPNVDAKDNVQYKLEIVGGFTYGDKKNWNFTLRERYYFKNKIKITTKKNDKERFTLFPVLLTELKATLSDVPPILPAEYDYFGNVRFIDEKDRTIYLDLPLLFSDNSGNK